jgi:hypothetical protein
MLNLQVLNPNSIGEYNPKHDGDVIKPTLSVRNVCHDGLNLTYRSTNDFKTTFYALGQSCEKRLFSLVTSVCLSFCVDKSTPTGLIFVKFRIWDFI